MLLKVTAAGLSVLAAVMVSRTYRCRSQGWLPARWPAVSSVLSHAFRLLIDRLGLLLLKGNKRAAEILALRHQVLVLQRRIDRPKFTPADRTVLSRAFDRRSPVTTSRNWTQPLKLSPGANERVAAE